MTTKPYVSALHAADLLGCTRAAVVADVKAGMRGALEALCERLEDKTRLRKTHGLTGWVLHEEALTDEAAAAIRELRKNAERLARSIKLAEVPSALGPALMELGYDDHASWNGGWIAAVRFIKAHTIDAALAGEKP